MKYFKVFNTENEYLEYISSDEFISPNVSTLYDSTKTWINPETHDYSKDYFTIKSLADDNDVKLTRWGKTGNTEWYSLDSGNTWTQVPTGTSEITIATINSGETLMIKSEANEWASTSTNHNSLTCTKNYDVCGNIMSLIYGDDFKGKTEIKNPTSNNAGAFCGLFWYTNETGDTAVGSETLISAENLVLPATTLKRNACNRLFRGCTNLKYPPKELPATTLANDCYRSMFQNCTSLTAAPELPATSLAANCYFEMFRNCTSLTTAPELPATTLENDCCRSMFQNCTSLTTAPELPATTLMKECYYSMFQNCTSLTTAPKLPATTLAIDCYRSMFQNCTSLTTAPELPATSLAVNCYFEMFRNCTSLTTAPELPATTLEGGGCYRSMFQNCTSLTAAPALLATTLANDCYREMFNGCSNLNYIKCLATDISASNCTTDWVKNVSSSGTFVKSSSMTSWTTGSTGIPTNWTIYDDTHVDVTGVTISESTATVDKGNTYTLTASVLPSNATDKAVIWSTSDSSVATVSNGVVTGVGCGNATITVTTHEKGYTATCNMSVENHVTSVDLNTYIVTLATGNTYQLEATVLPADACDKSVTWTSNDPNVVTVDSNGFVSGVTTGSATVTVTSNDTNSATCNCSVTVNEGQHATGVTLSDAAITVNKDETYTLTATVLPIDAVDKSVTWTSSDDTIATVDSNGVVSGVASGDATVRVTTTDGGYTAQCSVNVTNIHDYSKDYFTIESLQDSNTITVVKGGANVNLSYSLDNGETWNTQTLSGTITIGTINTSEKIIFKASANKWGTAWNAYNRFNGSKQFKVYGNAMSLLNGDGFVNNSEFATGSSFNLVGLFYGTTTVIDASDLILPATTLYESSYNGMFRGCTNLVNGPKLLPALVVPKDGYSSFFEGCINLVGVPEIMATTVSGDTALNRMFCADRSNNKATPLTKGPVLRVTNPSAYANVYQQLFSGHGNLNEVTIHAEGTNLSFANWLNNVSSRGIIKKLSATTLTNGASGKPSGWTTEDID